MASAKSLARRIAVSKLAIAIGEETPINAKEVNDLSSVCGFGRDNMRAHLLRAGVRQDDFSPAVTGAGFAPTVGFWWVLADSERMSDEEAVLLTRKFVNGQANRDIDLQKIARAEEAALAYLTELFEEVAKTYHARDWREGEKRRKHILKTIDAYVEAESLPRYGVRR